MPHYLVIRTACDVIKPADLKILVQQGKDNKRRVRAMGNYPERTWQNSLNRLHKVFEKKQKHIEKHIEQKQAKGDPGANIHRRKKMRAISSAAKTVKANSM